MATETEPPIVLPDDPSLGPEVQVDYPGYRSTRWRVARAAARHAARRSSTRSTGPVFGEDALGELDNDLTRQHDGEPLGERIIVTGRVLDEDGRPIPNTLVEVWQANAAGRYRHEVDQHPAPLDPNFSGAGRCLTDDDGRYRFVTDQAGRLPVGEPRERLAARAHPLLGLRARVHAAARHADVLPRRPAVRVRPDLQLGARPEGARAARSRASTSRRRSPSGRSATGGTSSSAAAARHDAARGHDAAADALADRRARTSRSACRRRAQNELADRAIRRRSARSGALLDGEGEPIADGVVELWDAGRRALGPLRHRCRGPLLVRRDEAGRAAGRGAAARRVRLRARAAQAPADAASTSRTRRRERSRPGARRRSTRTTARRSSPRRRTALAVRHPPAGRAADRLLRALTTFGPLFVPAPLREAVSDRAWLRAMLDAERALAAATGADRRTTASDREPSYDLDALVRGGPAPTRTRSSRSCARCASGRPRRARAPATSQDILDTAAMLVARDARDARSWRELDGACRGVRASSPRRTASTPMAARTLLQQARADDVRAEGRRLARRARRRAAAARAALALPGAARRRRRARSRARRRGLDVLRVRGASSGSPSRSCRGTRTARRCASSARRSRRRGGARAAKIGARRRRCSRRPRSARCASRTAAARRRCRTSGTRSAAVLARACARLVHAHAGAARRRRARARARGRRLARRVGGALGGARVHGRRGVRRARRRSRGSRSTPTRMRGERPPGSTDDAARREAFVDRALAHYREQA